MGMRCLVGKRWWGCDGSYQCQIILVLADPKSYPPKSQHNDTSKNIKKENKCFQKAAECQPKTADRLSDWHVEQNFLDDGINKLSQCI
jgi:hypothetical protein